MDKKLYTFLFPAITLACLAAAVFLPYSMFFLCVPLTLAASLCCAMSFALNKSPVLPLFVIFIFLLLFLYTGSPSKGLFYMFIFLPVGASVGVCYRYRSSLNRSAMVAVLSSGVMFLVMCVTYILESSPVFSVSDAIKPFREMTDIVANDVYTQLSAYPSAISQSQLVSQLLGMGRETFANTIFINLVYIAPLILAVAVLLLTVFVYFVMKKIFLRGGSEIAFMTSFDTVRASRTAAGLYMISVLLSAFLSFTSQNTVVYLVVYIFSQILSYALAFCGLSVVWYYLKTRNFGKGPRVLIFIFVIFLCCTLSFLTSVLAFIGVWDALTDLRQRFNGRFGI